MRSKNEFKDRLEPRDWDFDAFLKNGKTEFYAEPPPRYQVLNSPVSR